MDKKTAFYRKTIVVCLGAMICCILWGSAFPCIKLGYSFTGIDGSDTATQILYAGIRFTLAGVLTILFGAGAYHKVVFPHIGNVIKLSMLQTVGQYIFFYIGLAHTSGVKASIIEGLNVFVAILVASLIFRQESLTASKVIGCVLGFAGVVLVNLSGAGIDFNMNFFGEGFIFFSTVAYAFSSVLMKKYSTTENPIFLSGWQFITGGIIMMVIGLLMGGQIHVYTPQSIGMLVYLAFVSAVAYSLWSLLLKYNPISKVAVFGFMNPVCGVLLSALLLNEGSQLSVNAVFALALICVGIYIVNRKKDMEKKSIEE